MAINAQYSYWEIFYNPDIPIWERVAWAAVSPIAIPAAAIGLLQGCDSSKSSAEPEPESVSQKNSIDEYVSQCDGIAMWMSEVAACGQYPHQTNAKGYPSSASLYVPPDQDQWNVDRLLSTDKCIIKCGWWTPDQPKYNETSGLCEYLLVVPQGNVTYANGSPYIGETTITTEKSKAYGYFDYCLGQGYLP